jgi:general stress protein 26
MKPEGLSRIVDRLRDFDTAMLVTRGQQGELHGRPMQIADVDDGGRLTFVTHRSTGKVDDIAHDDHVVVCAQERRLFVRITGRAFVHEDRSRVDELWSETWRAWFPEGKDDPELVLVDVEPVECELWDEQGTFGLRSVASMAKAIATGQRADELPGRQAGHEVVRP